MITEPKEPQSAPTIKVQDLHFAYPNGDFGITIPQLEIAPGESVAFIGPSGSGKTTLLQLLSGVLKPTSGEVRLGDFVVSKASDEDCRDFRIRMIGMVFQEFELIEALTVQENILLPFLVEPKIGDAEDFMAELLRLTEGAGISQYLGRKPRRLSQGERQRVAICRALLPNPSIILADEPTGNLDPQTRESVLDLIDSEVEHNQATLIAVTHDHGILDRFDRVVDFAEFLENSK